ncbi:MAG: NAD-dependent epimerase/dehydratase family protein [Bacteroidetes bacterium]|nr:NAD-dependent epimerase/dehydratase family protein [Bacteroidota bacterium]
MIIVTGGTGLLGSHLLCELVKKHSKIIAGYQTESKIQDVQKLFQYYFKKEGEQYFSKVEWRKIDILDLLDLEDLIQEGDEVYHCAALVSFHRADFYKLMKINREGTANLVNTCLDKNASKLCYVSSTAAIGGGKEGSVDETNKWKKSKFTSAYSISKFSAEKEVWRGISEGLNAVIVNPCVILGAGRWEEGSLAIFKHLQNGAMFYPPGANATVDARDVAEIMVTLMEREMYNERYLCIGSNQSFKELFQTISTKLKVKIPRRQVPIFLLKTIGFIGSVFTYLTGKKLPMSKDTAHSAIGRTSYENKKLVEALDFEFRNFETTIKNAIDGRIQ